MIIYNRSTFLQNQSAKKQQGSAMIMAIFIMVVLMLLGTTLVNILSTSSETIAQEVLGTRALAAAKSGMQGQLQILFPLNSPDTQGPCSLTATEYDFLTVPGLYECEASVTCDEYANFDNKSYYRLTSVGVCGGVISGDSQGVVVSSRKVQVEARSL